MADLIRLYDNQPNPKVVDDVVRVLQSGGIIIYPTDTVYALGCDITKARAVERVAKIKGVKPEKANFSLVCNDLSHLSNYVTVEQQYLQAAKKSSQALYIYPSC